MRTAITTNYTNRNWVTTSYGSRTDVTFLMTQALDFLMTEDDDFLVTESSYALNSEYSTRTAITTNYT